MIEPQTFSVDGCVKFVYPHSHNEALLIALENQTRKQPLRHTVPDGTLCRISKASGLFRSSQLSSEHSGRISHGIGAYPPSNEWGYPGNGQLFTLYDTGDLPHARTAYGE